MYRYVFVFLSGALVSPWQSMAQSENGQKLKPNLIVILADDQGWGDLGFNGNSSVNTPNIDSLASNGLVMERFFVSPVCSPTRAEFLTGRYHVRSGVYDVTEGGEMMDISERTIGDVFKDAGYVTGVFGKWHNGAQYPYHPNGRGFSEFYGFCSGHWGSYFNARLERNGGFVESSGYLTDDLTDKGLQFVERNKERSFFLFLPLNTPHSPMQVPDQWFKKFEHHRPSEPLLLPKEENIGHTRAALAMTENIDWNVGRILAKLKDLNLERNTIVVYFSDNGPNGVRWNGAMKGVKGSTDEGGCRSPLIIHWPGQIAEGTKIDRIASAIDLLPTLADLAGVSMGQTKPLDGRSLVPLIQGSADTWEERVIYTYWAGRLSLRSQNFRLDHLERLYQMESDPSQSVDLSNQMPEMKAVMKKQKDKWLGEVFPVDFKTRRDFPVGHPDFSITHLPARDGQARGNIRRSNKYPNCSYFTNWTKETDAIVWPVDVLSSGDYFIDIYYTCPSEDIGSTIQLGFRDSSIENVVTDAFDPPLRGMEHDRVKRAESFVKDFKKMRLGVLHLKKGKGELILSASHIPKSQAMDFGWLTLVKQ